SILAVSSPGDHLNIVQRVRRRVRGRPGGPVRREQRWRKPLTLGVVSAFFNPDHGASAIASVHPAVASVPRGGVSARASPSWRHGLSARVGYCATSPPIV